MLTIAYYFLQVVLCSGMMIGYYWLILRNKRFHQYNRFYLLAAALLSWIVPLIKITWSHPVVISEQPQMMQFLSVVADNNSQIEQTISKQPVSEWSWDLLVTGIYFCVAAILFFGMVHAFTRLYRLLRDHSCKNVGDIYLVLTQAKGTPFSFFRYIFWNEEIDIRSEAGKQILQHELTHVQQKHSFDKLFMQVILIGGWFNPFFWLLRKEMDMIHEFIADKKAVNNGDAASLAQMLLTAAYPQQQFALTHPFFFSPIKRRLQMLTNNKNPRYSYIRRLVVLPLLAIVIVLFAFRSKEGRENTELSVATVMENVATDQKQLFNSFLQGIGNFFESKTPDQNNSIHSIFYNGRPLTVPTSFRLRDLSRMMVMPHLDKDHLNLVPAVNLTLQEIEPLYVIDGVKQTNKNAFHVLNPDDIQMIQIWKGADAIAKYGDAGKEGVIEITTKLYADKKAGDGFSGLVYEGVAKDPLGNIAKNSVMYLKVIIYQGETDKTQVWEETHVVQSNDNGAFTFTIGKDVKSSTKPETEMVRMNWTNGPYFVNLKTAIAPLTQGGSWTPQQNYIDGGTTKMATIPFLSVVALNGYFHIKGKDVTIAANATAVVTINFSDAKKGDQVYIITPNEDKVNNWAAYYAWVEEDGIIKVRFVNYTDKPVFVAGDSYLLGLLGKFEGLPAGSWVLLDKLPYMAVTSTALDPLGNPAKNRKVLIKDIIYQGKAIGGTKVWEETQEVTTNNEGVFTVYVGHGTKSPSIAATHLSKIEWGTGPFFINYKVAVFPSVPASWWVAGDNLVDMGTAQMLSIPHSLYDPTNADNSFSITDSMGNVNWQLASVTPLKRYPDTLVWIQGQKVPAKGRLLSDGVIRARAESIPLTVKGKLLPPTLQGFGVDNSPAVIEFKKRNPDVSNIIWRETKTRMSLLLKDGTEETYDLTKPESKKRAETKYGKLPDLPGVTVENIPNNNPLEEVTVVGYGTRNNLTVPGTIRGGTFSGTLTARTYNSAIIPAEFPGGLSAWVKYLERNLDTDVPLKKGAPPGRYTVDLLFDISEDGTISNIKAQNDPGYGTREEAINLIAKSPKWTPALRDGKKVGYTHKQSISFFVKDPKAEVKPKDKNLNLIAATGTNVTIAPESTAWVTVNIPGVKMGDPIIVIPQDDYTDWGIYSSWVLEENKVKIRFANYTKKEVKVLGNQYKVTVIKS